MIVSKVYSIQQLEVFEVTPKALLHCLMRMFVLYRTMPKKNMQKTVTGAGGQKVMNAIHNS